MNTFDVPFSPTRKARAVLLGEGERGGAAVAALGLRPAPLVVFVFGGADTLPDGARKDLARLFADAVLPAVAEAGGVLVDGATDSGVMQILGRARAESEAPPPLVGVAVARLVCYPQAPCADGEKRPRLEAGHSHFVLAPGSEWGDETRTMEEVLRVLGEGGCVVGVMAGGGGIAERERQLCERRGWPVVLLDGAGGAADAAVDAGGAPVFPLAGSAAELKALLLGLDAAPAHAVHEATLLAQWRSYVEYDRSATEQQRQFYAIFSTILVGGGVATLLAILSGETALLAAQGHPVWAFARTALRLAAIVAPLLITALAAYLTLFKPSNKWVLLRGAAEAIKREIYRYRTATGPYAPGAGDNGREQTLVLAVGAIKQSTQQTEANTSALWTGQPPSGKALDDPLKHVWLASGDDGLSPLNGSQYVRLRIEDQTAFFRRKCLRLDRQRRHIQIAMLVAGGFGSFLAAIERVSWVALTTAVATALGSYIGVQQFEPTVVKYNQTRVDLETLSSWWRALSTRQRADRANVERLVTMAEETLERELRGWVQHMQEALKDPTATETQSGPQDDALDPEEDEERAPQPAKAA